MRFERLVARLDFACQQMQLRHDHVHVTGCRSFLQRAEEKVHGILQNPLVRVALLVRMRPAVARRCRRETPRVVVDIVHIAHAQRPVCRVLTKLTELERVRNVAIPEQRHVVLPQLHAQRILEKVSPARKGGAKHRNGTRAVVLKSTTSRGRVDRAVCRRGCCCCRPAAFNRPCKAWPDSKRSAQWAHGDQEVGGGSLRW